ncbi:MAG: YheB [bacterium]|nr:MAG: YheB [bacterium]
MINFSQYLLPPVIGAIIGWFTNKQAIWMLFNPKKEKRVFGLRVPFTPGLIPRDQILIAKSLGALIEEKLINSEEIDLRITKEEINGKIKELMDKAVEKNMGKLAFLIPETVMNQVKKFFAPKISELVKDELFNFLNLINVKQIVEDKVSSFPIEELEEAIQGVTQKHLTYIVNLGGVLGFIIGLIQVVVNMYLQ